MYFVIQNNDGDTSVDTLLESELKERLDLKYYGDVAFKDRIEETDTNYWGENEILIIKGEICVPKPKEIVQTYEL